MRAVLVIIPRFMLYDERTHCGIILPTTAQLAQTQMQKSVIVA